MNVFFKTSLIILLVAAVELCPIISFIPTRSTIRPFATSPLSIRQCDNRFVFASFAGACNFRGGNCFLYRYDSEVLYPRLIHREPFILFAIRQDDDKTIDAPPAYDNNDDKGENKITMSPEIYQNVVAKFLSNFMSKSNDQRNDVDKKYDSDEKHFFERRNEIMNDVIRLQQTDEYWNQPTLSLPINILAQILDYEIYNKEWFVTGHVNPVYFSLTNFTFQDPDVKMNSIRSYAAGVQQIFDYRNTARAEIISTSINSDDDQNNNVITCTWRLSGKVNIGPSGLTIKPYIVYTDFTVCNDTGLIVYQKDRFDIPSWDILLSAIFPFLIGRFTAPPAPKPQPRTPIMPDISMHL